jgi:hypothetical protein
LPAVALLGALPHLKLLISLLGSTQLTHFLLLLLHGLLLQFLVLGWAVSQRDLELLIKLVGQLISSAAADGGATIVVLTQREKLEMEELFR